MASTEWTSPLPQRHSAHLKTEPSLSKSVEDGIRRCQSEGTFLSANAPTRHQTLIADPKFLAELRTLPKLAPTRHQTLIADPKFLAELRRLKDAQSKVLPTSPVAKPKISVDAEEVSAQLPEDGWVFSASEEPFTLRSWQKRGGLDEEESELVARIASDWGVAASSCKGCKSKNDSTVGQDNFLLAKLPNNWKVLGVLDGHGHDGHWPAMRMTETVPHFLQQAGPSGMSIREEPCVSWLQSGDVVKALTQAFKDVEEDLEAYAVEMGKDLDLCGSTATVALIPPSQDSVWVATVGDSRAVLLDHRRVLHETSDHKATRQDEAERIKQAGGHVINTEYEDGTEDSRITPKDMASPQIAISRSMGDLIFKSSGVTAVPEIVEWKSFNANDTYLVVCSDGVWEFLSGEEVRDFLQDAFQSGLCAPEVAHGLLQLAQKTWKQNEAFYCDDITVVLCSLRGTLPVKNVTNKKEPCPSCEGQTCFTQ